MLFEGTVRQKGRGFDLLVRSLGGVHNGYTSMEETVYHVTVPSAGYREVPRALVELVRGGELPGERFEGERRVITQELREGEDNVRRLASKVFSETIFRVHPYRYRVGGEISEFEKLTHDDLKEYHAKLYVPGNEMVVIAGDVEVGEAMGLARGLLAEAPAKPLPDISRPPEPEQTAPRYAEMRHSRAKKARVMYAWRTVDLLHPDLFALDVLAMILGEGRSSRLYRSLKEEEGIVYAVGAYSWTPRDPGYLGVWAQCDDSNVEPARGWRPARSSAARRPRAWRATWRAISPSRAIRTSARSTWPASAPSPRTRSSRPPGRTSSTRA
jgi:zinc protease